MATTMNRTATASFPAFEDVVTDFDQVVIGYDRDSDTLMVHFYGLGIPGISVPNDDGWYLRWDRLRTHPIGIQLEGFLARAVHDEPGLLDALLVAYLRDITVEEIAGIRRSVGLPPVPDESIDVPDLLRRLWRFATAAPESVANPDD